MKRETNSPLTLIISEEKGGTEFKASVIKGLSPTAHTTSADFDEVLKWFEEKRAEFKRNGEAVSVIIQTRHVKLNGMPLMYTDSNTNEHKQVSSATGVKDGGIYKSTGLFSVDSVTITTSTGLEIILPSAILSPCQHSVGEAEEPTTSEVEEIYAANPILENEAGGIPDINITYGYNSKQQSNKDASQPCVYIYPFDNSNWNEVYVSEDFNTLPGFMQYFFFKWAYYMAVLKEQNGNSAFHASRADILALADCTLKKLPLQPIGNFLTGEFLNSVGAHMAVDRAQAISNFIQKVQSVKKGRNVDASIEVKEYARIMNNFSADTLYRSKKFANTYYPITLDGKGIVVERPITVDVSNYKRTGSNNAFDVFEIKTSARTNNL